MLLNILTSSPEVFTSFDYSSGYNMQAIMATEEVESFDPTMPIPVSK
jgi:hypothetical protein